MTPSLFLVTVFATLVVTAVVVLFAAIALVGCTTHD